MATHNSDITVNVYGESQSVDIKSFGQIVHGTEAVDTGFTELYRLYESNNDAQSDADLLAGAKAAAAAFFSQPNRPKQLAIAKVDYEDIGDELKNSFDALLAAWPDFYAICCASRAKVDQDVIADWAAANDRLASIQSSDSEILAGTAGNLFETLEAAGSSRSFGSWHPTDTDYVDLAWLASILSANPDEQSSVAHSRRLVGPTAPTPTEVNSTQAAQVKAYNGNLYLPLYGPDVMRPGLTWSGKTIEDQILEDWFEARLQEAIAAMVIRQSEANSKLSFDDFGIGMAEGEIRGVVALGESVGHFVEGSLVCTPPKYEDLTSVQIASRSVTIPLTVRKRVGLADFTLNVGVTF